MNKAVLIVIKGQEITAHFPNIGQMLRIEQQKQVLTEGRYALMAFSGLAIPEKLLDIVDMICYFSVVVPKFSELAGIDNPIQLLDMNHDSELVKGLVKQYKEAYQPFFNKIYTREDRPEKSLKAKKKAGSKNGNDGQSKGA